MPGPVDGGTAAAQSAGGLRIISHAKAASHSGRNGKWTAHDLDLHADLEVGMRIERQNAVTRRRTISISASGHGRRTAIETEDLTRADSRQK